MKKYNPKLLFLLLLNVPVVYAQTEPDVGRLLEEQKKSNQLPALPARAPKIMPKEAVKVAPKADELRVTVKEFRIDGEIKAFPVATLQGVLADLIGKSLTISELQQAADRISTYYRNQGYILATALLPKQDVTAGIITLKVFEGKLDRTDGVKIKGSMLRVNPQVLQAIVQSSVPADQAVQKESLERALLLIADLPGLSATSKLEAGSDAGATRVVVQAAEGDLLVPSLSFNNHGNIYTGAYQVLAGVNVNDPLGIGDQLGVNLTHSILSLLNSARINYSLPIGSDGWRAGIAYTDLKYKLSGLDPDPQSTGTAKDWTINASYPLIRTLQRNLSLTATYDFKRLYTDQVQVATSDKRVDVLALGLNWDNQDELGGGGLNMASVQAVSGKLDLSRVATDAVNDAAAAQTAGHYSKFLWSGSRTQRLGEEYSLLVQATGQQAQKNLDGGEKFTLGGPYGVRAYPVSEAPGDDGYRFTIEPRWSVGRISDAVDFQVSAFYDKGHIKQNHSVWSKAAMTTPNAYDLSGDGVSMIFTRPGFADLRLTYAHKLGSNPGTRFLDDDPL